MNKLMKYEFMATGRVFLPLFAALLLVSGVNRFSSEMGLRAPQIIGTVLSVILIVGICVVSLILTLQRFRRNLLSSEGYLTMTLPVRTDSLILSKLFVASIWLILSFIAVVLAILIMALTSLDFNGLKSAIRFLIEFVPLSPMQLAFGVLELIVLIVLAIFSGILLLYTCMSLSMLVDRRRGLFTFGAYVVITTILQVLAVLIGVVLDATGILRTFDLSRLNSYGMFQVVILLVLAVEAAMCAAYYFTTRFMLKRRLNLL